MPPQSSQRRKILIESYLEAKRLDYVASERSLTSFVKSAWQVLEPNTKLLWNWHHDLMCEYLSACSMGQIQRLIINVCPRSTKSLITSVSFPCWEWVKKPHKKFLFGCYADTLATSQSMLRRNLLASDWYAEGYRSRFNLVEDMNTKSEFKNNKTGFMKGVGIKGSVTGFGSDYIIIDDPQNPKGAESEKDRETTLQNFDLGWSNRLNDKKTGVIIIIMQRLHENDLTGHLLSKNLGYQHVKIPSIAEERETIFFPVTKRTLVREAGDYMHKERDGEKELNQAKIDMGPYGFSGQHQQNPTPSEGGEFKATMFDFADLPSEFDYTFIMADTAYSDKEENDFTVFTAFGVKAGELYVIDVYRKQIKASDIEVPITAFINRFQNYGFRGAYIEPKGHGIYLNQALPRRGIIIPNEEDLKTFFADRRLNKVERASNSVPYLANRRVHISNLIAEKEILLSEVLRFPKAKHDDFTDTIIDGIKYTFARSISILDAY